jgi:GT2 family glycosyltransferase
LLLRRDVIEKVGYLSEDYFLFSEENDYFTRLKQAGKKSVYLPTIELIHLIGKSREKRIKIDSEKNFLRSRLLYFRKFHPGSLFFFKLIYYLFFGWSYIFGLLSKLIKGNDEYKILYGTLLRTLGGKE